MTDSDKPRLIERAFPLKQASLDSVHEKNVRHGHISTLHIWPARRPLAACRAALIATLLPDPGTGEDERADAEARRKLIEKIGGRIVPRIEKKKVNGNPVEVEREETIGGILHWGRESDPDMNFFREEIRKAYGGRAPRVLDPFAGGGAIPLEAMRLGCEVTAIDINPVAWFILKCTLEYPQKLAGQKRPLPDFVLRDRDFMESFLKAQGFKGATLRTQLERIGLGEKNDPPQPSSSSESIPGGKQAQKPLGLAGDARMFEADLAWHVRAWGWWVLQRAKADLERFYPTIEGKPTVAYLWARTVKCKNCRATMPLLKTKWLCKKDNKRILLKVEPNADKTGVIFSILSGEDAATQGGNGAQRREFDKRLGAGTMSRAGAKCPCCTVPSMKMEDIQFEGKNGRLGSTMTAVVVLGPNGKEYRLPTEDECRLGADAYKSIKQIFGEIPFGIPDEAIVEDAKHNTWCVQYGVDRFSKLFSPRQLLAVGTIAAHTRAAYRAMAEKNPDEMPKAVLSFLALALDRFISFNCLNVRWKLDAEAVVDAFSRFAIPLLWDCAEPVPTGDHAGAYLLCYERICTALDVLMKSCGDSVLKTFHDSAINCGEGGVDLILTDPPYYEAIGYAVIMDFFYVWLRRTLHGISPDIDEAFREPLGPKWNAEKKDGELIDDSSRFGGDKAASKAAYEEGMFRAFQACYRVLVADGRMVVVFANKNPNAWETLVSAVIRAGFVVDGSWPIQTEMGNRTRALSSAALASSVWLVCRKRREAARPGWDNRVLDEMRENIYTQLREFWDAGIRGPDFVWAATGPAMEAYSKHPVVKKANEPGATMEVSEFLRAVRRIVVDFVVGRVLTHDGEASTVSGLDDVTTYYLLHRHDFGMDDAPIGACILYAISCGLSDTALADHEEILQRTGGNADAEDDDESEAAAASSDDAEAEKGSGSKVKLRPWNKRVRKSMGYDSDSKPAPLIDQVHRLMHLWRAGDVVRVDEYVDARGLRRSAIFHHLLQALIELAPAGSDERSLLESISNHIASRPLDAPERQGDMFKGSQSE